jgi:two-component system chemotaxis response regulator CheY
MKILIADDDKVCRTILSGILAKLPEHQTTVVEDGKEAWAMLDDVGRYFDVAFLDIDMPGFDGLQLLKRIRETPLLRSVEVVISTASSDRATIGRAIACGARHYIVKPFNESTIAAKLQQIAAAAAPAAKKRS